MHPFYPKRDKQRSWNCTVTLIVMRSPLVKCGQGWAHNVCFKPCRMGMKIIWKSRPSKEQRVKRDVEWNTAVFLTWPWFYSYLYLHFIVLGTGPRTSPEACSCSNGIEVPVAWRRNSCRMLACRITGHFLKNKALYKQFWNSVSSAKWFNGQLKFYLWLWLWCDGQENAKQTVV